MVQLRCHQGLSGCVWRTDCRGLGGIKKSEGRCRGGEPKKKKKKRLKEGWVGVCVGGGAGEKGGELVPFKKAK